MVLVGFVVINHALQHGFQETVYGYYLAIGLRVIWCRKLMDKIKEAREVLKQIVLECVPWSDTNYLGKPKRVITCLKKNQGAVSVVLLNLWIASTHFVK